MIFSRTNRQIDLPKQLVISNMPIYRKQESRFLGVIIDESLNWSRHVKTVLSKMSRYIGVMYRIKKFLPLRARLQVYHSFVQSHINYCSLVWGFSCRSNIEALIARQKKVMRAVIPGFINYKYRKGCLPGHTKSAFSAYKILTIQNIISFNSFLFMFKVEHFPLLLPLSIRKTISSHCSRPDSTHITCENWLNIYNNFHYSKSLFYKGPLLFSQSNINKNISPACYHSIQAYKRDVKMHF